MLHKEYHLTKHFSRQKKSLNWNKIDYNRANSSLLYWGATKNTFSLIFLKRQVLLCIALDDDNTEYEQMCDLISRTDNCICWKSATRPTIERDVDVWASPFCVFLCYAIILFAFIYAQCALNGQWRWCQWVRFWVPCISTKQIHNRVHTVCVFIQ